MKIYVDDYKLKSDTLDTDAINKAISISNAGDIIVFSNRLYRSGTINLKSNIHLFLDDNTKILASDSIIDFCDGIEFNEKLDVNTFINCDYNGLPKLFFFYGKNLENVTISGKGIIDGNESIFYGEETADYIEGAFYPRMPLMYLENIKNLNISGVTLTNSAFWTVHLIGCDTVKINNIKILNNRRMLNADGIDPDHSKNIEIDNVYIESADDCIAIKNTEYFQKYGDSYNIVVKNSTFKSSSASLKIGTETFGNFHDIRFEDIKILDSNRAISIQLRDTGIISDIYFKNIDIESHMFYHDCFWGKGEAIAITSLKRYDNTNLGMVKNIYFDNIKAKSEHGIFLYGNISDLFFNNINIECVDYTKYDKRVYDLRPCEDNKMINTTPKVIYAVGVNNIHFSNFKCNNLYEIINEDDNSYISFE